MKVALVNDYGLRTGIARFYPQVLRCLITRRRAVD